MIRPKHAPTAEPAPPRRARAAAAPAPRGDARPLYEQVAERLRGAILGHALAPGSWIDEKALTEAYGISRTPLREALKVLAAEGLVTMKPRRGAYVTEVTARDLAEVYHLLALLESDAAAAVAASASAAQVAELEALHAELEAQLGDRDRFFTANERFHRRLLEMADNRWRLQLVAELRQVMKLNRHHSLSRQGRLEASLREHRGIVAAIRARDAGRVASLMRAHFANGMRAAAPD